MEKKKSQPEEQMMSGDSDHHTVCQHITKYILFEKELIWTLTHSTLLIKELIVNKKFHDFPQQPPPQTLEKS